MSAELRCNGKCDCRDRSDEVGCTTTSAVTAATTASSVTTTEGKPPSLRPKASVPRGVNRGEGARPHNAETEGAKVSFRTRSVKFISRLLTVLHSRIVGELT